MSHRRAETLRQVGKEARTELLGGGTGAADFSSPGSGLTREYATRRATQNGAAVEQP